MPEFFKHLWTRRTAGNRYTSKILVETTNEIAQRVGLRSRCDVGGRAGGHRASGAVHEGRERVVPLHGDEQHHVGAVAAGRERPGPAAGGAADERTAVRVPGAGRRGLARADQLLRNGAEDAGHPREAVHGRDHVGDQVASEQPQRKRANAGGGPDRAHRSVDEDMRRGQRAEEHGSRTVRVSGRGVPRRIGFDSGRAEVDRERDGYGGDGAAHPRPAAASDAHSAQPQREGAGELHRPGGSHRRPRSGVRAPRRSGRASASTCWTC